MMLELVGHIHTAQIGMAVELDAEHVVGFALIPVRAAPDVGDGGDVWIALVAADFQENALIRLRITEIVRHFETIFALVAVDADRIEEMRESEVIFE